MKNSKDNLVSIMLNHLVNYPTPINFNYYFGYGSLSILCLVIQIISGLFLSMHYIPTADLAFMSVEHIMRDVTFGWHLRYIHANDLFLLDTYIFKNLIFRFLEVLKIAYELFQLTCLERSLPNEC
jgi:hypothetical protein